MRVVVQLVDPSAAERAVAYAAKAGVRLEPMHPGPDGPLRRFWVAHVQDPRRADAFAERMRTLADVDAAYVKPADEAPG